MNKYRHLILFLGILLVNSTLQATHFTGLLLSYTCTGPCTYRIFHRAYYDCVGAATELPPSGPPPPNVIINPELGCNPPVAAGPWIRKCYLDATPVCPSLTTRCTDSSAAISGVIEAIYYRDYDFCNVNCTGIFELTYQNCCRNSIITSGQADEDIFLKGPQINLGISPCNNSPVFCDPGTRFICAGLSHTIGVDALDPDGDSLSYSLVACLGDLSDTVTYNPGYDPLHPLGPTWDVFLHPGNGELTLTANPGNVVIGVLCVKVSEYRHGILISETTQDLQVQVVACGTANAVPVIDSVYGVNGGTLLAAGRFRACLGVPFGFSLDAHDPNVSDGLHAFLSHCPEPGWGINQSGSNPAHFTLSWVPNRIGAHYFTLVVADSLCPWQGETSFHFQIEVTPFCLDAVITDAPCGSSSGAIDLVVQGGIPPYSFLWSTGDTTEDLSGIPPGNYSVVVTDSSGKGLSQNFFVQSTNIGLTLFPLQPACNAPRGSISTAVNGGVPPYAYVWNTGDTTAMLSGLPPGGYSVTVFDSTGCPRHQATILLVPDSCFNTIEGTVFHDLNANCQQDTNEPGLARYFVDLSPGGATLTDSNGHYHFKVDTGNYTLQVYPWNFHSVLCPASGLDSVRFDSLGNTSTSHDFAIDILPVQDLRVLYQMSRARPGFSQWHSFTIFNEGSVPLSGTLEWEYDPIFVFQSANPAAASHSPAIRKATWQFQNLLPGKAYSVQALTQVGSNVATGVPFTNLVRALPTLGDTTPQNNLQIRSDTTSAAFDPNDKQVNPSGLKPQGFIQPFDKVMEYNIRFQNTGTDTAFFVVIRDTLDNDLDYRTFQALSSSHPYQLEVEGDSVLVFRFDHIHLPDSGTNLLGSQGFVSFRIRHQGTLVAGTEIRNKAAIYFDFNAPVITNEVLNTVYTQPKVSLGPDTAICQGQFLVSSLDSPGMPPYRLTWSTGAIAHANPGGVDTISIDSTGLYSLFLEDSFGFSSGDTVWVSALPLPDAFFTATQGVQTVAFISPSPANTHWVWDFGDGEDERGVQAVTHRYPMPGLYTVTLIASNECGSDTSTQVLDLRSTALDTREFSARVQLGPNPFSKTTMLRFPNPNGHLYRLQLFDLAGKNVGQFPPTRGELFEIQRADLAPGVYLYELKGEFHFRGRLVVR